MAVQLTPLAMTYYVLIGAGVVALLMAILNVGNVARAAGLICLAVAIAVVGLIVQGNADTGAQGSGTGDNCFEIDGAEDCFWQPVTTTAIYNVTAIGMPDSPAVARVGCDEGTTWRASARVQYRNCIFMDLGEELVQVDATDDPSLIAPGAPREAARFLVYTSGSTADPKGALHSDTTLLVECGAQPLDGLVRVNGLAAAQLVPCGARMMGVAPNFADEPFRRKAR